MPSTSSTGRARIADEQVEELTAALRAARRRAGLPAGRAAKRRPRWYRNPWVIGPLGLIAVASWVSAYSAWTDSVQASTSTSAGSINIQAGGLDSVLNLSGLNLSNVLPGATSYAGLVIKNAGTADIVYAMGASSANSGNRLNTLLGDALQLGVTVVPNGQTCDAAHFTSPSETLSALTPGLNRSSIFTNRPLAAGQSETLCFKQLLPLAAPAALMSATTDTLFTFTASSPS